MLSGRQHVKRNCEVNFTLQTHAGWLLDMTVQVAQLSQRDRAAECVIVLAKSERLELEDNILRTL